ncbi:HK97 gp10 family phage protein [Trueperella pyogenes]
MPSGDLVITEGPVRLRVTGWAKLARSLEAAGADAQDMRRLMHELGKIVVKDAKRRVPTDSQALRKTLRAGRGKTKAVVRAGSRAVPYASIQHYGTPPGFTTTTGRRMPLPVTEYLTKALQATQGDVYRHLLDGISKILDRNDL